MVGGVPLAAANDARLGVILGLADACRACETLTPDIARRGGVGVACVAAEFGDVDRPDDGLAGDVKESAGIGGLVVDFPVRSGESR